jgi:hypothetical protein
MGYFIQMKGIAAKDLRDQLPFDGLRQEKDGFDHSPDFPVAYTK